MKLRNKKTREIRDFIINKDKIQTASAIDCWEYTSLAELNEEWEDCEEPGKYWGIDYSSCRTGGIEEFSYDNDNIDEFNKSIGNHFETKEETEKAVDKLKARKRLKDKGFKFKYWTYKMDEPKIENHTHFMIVGVCEDGVRFDDLDLLFGGEE